MSIRALRSFIAISKYGSFAAAADHIGLSQAAVSLQVKKLEDGLECELFDRSGHKPILNTRGQMLLVEAEEIINHYDRLKGIVHQDESFSGPLIIGSINTVQVNPLPNVIFEIQEAHPYLQISIKSGLSAELAIAVDMGRLDFAITTEPELVLPQSLSWKPYFDEPFYVIAPLNFKEDTPKELLENHPYVCFDRQAWAGRKVERRLRQEGIATHETMELDSLEATLKMAQASLGVAVVSLPDARKKEIEKTMKVVPFTSPPFSRPIGLIYKTDSRWASVINTFFDALKHHSLGST